MPTPVHLPNALTLRQRVFLTLLPLVALVLALGVAGMGLLQHLGTRTDEILRENYASVVAMERLNEALERIDSSFQFALAGQELSAKAQYEANWGLFRDSLRVEQGNITLPGEKEAVERLTSLTERYREQGDAFYARAGGDRPSDYFAPEGLLDLFKAIKASSGEIRRMNADNMEEASRRAKATAALSVKALAAGLVAAIALAAFAMWNTGRWSLAPIKQVTESALAIGQGNLEQSIRYAAADELGALARAFNRMVAELRASRASVEARTAELRRAEEKYRSIFENAIDGIFQSTPEGRFLTVNRAMAGMLGYATPEELMTSIHHIGGQIHADPHRRVEFALRLAKEGVVRDFEAECLRKDGSTVWLSFTARAVRDPTTKTGDVLFYEGFVADVTTRRLAEEQVMRLAHLHAVAADLGERALRLESFAALLDEAVLRVAKALDVDFCNVMELLPGGETFLLRAGVGWTKGQVGRVTIPSQRSQPGYTVRSKQPVILEDAAAETRFVPVAVLMGETVESSMSVVIPTSRGPYGALGAHSRRRRVFTKDEVDFLQTVASVLGAAIERLRSEDAVRESEANLNRAQELAHLGSWHLDVVHNRLTWSDEVFRIFGVPLGTPLTYEAFLDAVDPEDRERVEKVWTAAMQGAPYDLEHRIRVGGQRKWVRERAKVTFEDGRAIEGTGTVQDVTARRLAQDETAALATLQTAVAELGQRALRSGRVDAVLDDAVALVANTLAVPYCELLELLAVGTALRLRAGVGWKEGLIGQATVGAGKDSQAGYTLLSNEPIVVEDLRCETRFTEPQLLLDHGVVSGMSVVIATSAGPYGVLGAHTRAQRAFTKNEVNFLRAVANVVGAMTERFRAEDHLRRLNRAHRALSSCNEALIRASDELAWMGEVCRIIVEAAGYRFCWVGRADHDEQRRVHPIAHAGVEEGYLAGVDITWADSERGRGPTGTCIRTGTAVVVKNVASDARFAPWRAEASKRGYLSCAAIPILLDAQRFGALNIYAAEADAFSEAEMGLLTELAGDLAYGITALRTRGERDRTQVELQALNRDLEQRVAARTAELQSAREQEAATGARIQQMLLLDEPPDDVPGLRIAAHTFASQRIAGDFYGFFRHEESDCVDLFVADVMGKGVPAALLSAATKSCFPEALWHLMARTVKGQLPEPKDIVTLAHTHVAEQLIDIESFVTLCYGRFDVAKRKLDLVDCGHTGVLHRSGRTGACEIVHGADLPFGVRQGEIFDQTSIALEPEDLVVFYSDGVTEARNARGALFGPGRLLECVRRHASLDPGALVNAVRDEAVAFSGDRPLADDLTCVVVKVLDEERPLARSEVEIRSTLADLRRAREFVEAFCRRLPGEPFGDDAVASVMLAVDEAATNVMKHAYHGRDDQRIELKAEAFRDRVTIRLRYLGAPFDPSSVPSPSFDGTRESGFGVYLISKSVDAVRYYRDHLRRSCILLEKRRNT